MTKYNRFRFHWRDGKVEEGEGKDVADALTQLGYGNGALRALDYWEHAAPKATALEGAA